MEETREKCLSNNFQAEEIDVVGTHCSKWCLHGFLNFVSWSESGGYHIVWPIVFLIRSVDCIDTWICVQFGTIIAGETNRNWMRQEFRTYEIWKSDIGHPTIDGFVFNLANRLPCDSTSYDKQIKLFVACIVPRFHIGCDYPNVKKKRKPPALSRKEKSFYQQDSPFFFAPS